MTTTDYQAGNGWHTQDHEAAPAKLGSETGAASSTPKTRTTRKTTPAALDDTVVRNYLAALAMAECKRIEPTQGDDNSIERVNALLVINKLTAAATELRAG
jgi:hypothetical protein